MILGLQTNIENLSAQKYTNTDDHSTNNTQQTMHRLASTKNNLWSLEGIQETISQIQSIRETSKKDYGSVRYQPPDIKKFNVKVDSSEKKKLLVRPTLSFCDY